MRIIHTVKPLSSLLLMLLFFDGTFALEGFQVSEVAAFVSPDSSYLALEEYVENSNASFYVNVYTFDSPSIARLIARAEKRGVDVILVVDPSPVGGISKEGKQILGYLESSGVEVYYSDVEDVRFNHAKYAISDNSSILITSENFGKTGIPKDNSYGNRGFGVVVYDSNFTSYYLDVFFSDLNGSKRYRRADVYLGGGNVTNRTIYFEDRGNKGGYDPRFGTRRYRGTFKAVPVVAPENAVETILGLIDSANVTLYVEQLYVYKYWGPKKKGSVETSPNLFLEASIDAARRGVTVKILLDGSWYNVEKDNPTSNLHTVEYVNEIAENEGLNLEARLVDLKKTGFSKIHAKGLIVDDRAVLISSVNWNEHSPTKNREIGVIIYGEPAGYFSSVFLYDFEGKEPGIPGFEVSGVKAVTPVMPILVAAGLSALFIWKMRRGRRRR